MRKYPHKPDQKILSAIRAEDEESYRSKPAKAAAAEAARNPVFFHRCRVDAQNLAALQYAFEAPDEMVRGLLAEACGHATKALSYKVTLDDGMYNNFLGLAILTGNTTLRHDLESLSREGFTNSNIDADEIFYLGSETFRDLAAGRDTAARHSVETAIARARSGGVDTGAKETVLPMLLMEQAILDADPAKLASAVDARHEDIRKSYTPKEGRNSPYALLDVVGLGLLALAKARGIPTPSTSVYLPAGLL